mgnify:CR=1 FL=1
MANLLPAGASGTVIWSSSDSSIATVDTNGLVTNLNASSTDAMITITAACGVLAPALWLVDVSELEAPGLPPPNSGAPTKRNTMNRALAMILPSPQHMVIPRGRLT